jgi:dTDP-4-dehydrorhamnose reductase
VEACEKGLTGLYHVAGADTLDRWAFTQLVVETFGLDGSHLTPVKTAELTQKAARPLEGGLRVGKAQAALATPLRGAAEGLRAFYLGFTA